MVALGVTGGGAAWSGSVGGVTRGGAAGGGVTGGGAAGGGVTRGGVTCFLCIAWAAPLTVEGERDGAPSVLLDDELLQAGHKLGREGEEGGRHKLQCGYDPSRVLSV